MSAMTSQAPYAAQTPQLAHTPAQQGFTPAQGYTGGWDQQTGPLGGGTQEDGINKQGHQGG
ncbi:hypothetical protein T484DRAFT_1770168 [Baffinella frigidus]|nr:hypothetical protein T484DRAFT_1770168 [Cryptophyta sp. CCMP2293]